MNDKEKNKTKWGSFYSSEGLAQMNDKEKNKAKN